MKGIILVHALMLLQLASDPAIAQTSCGESALMEADRSWAKAAAEKNLAGVMA